MKIFYFNTIRIAVTVLPFLLFISPAANAQTGNKEISCLQSEKWWGGFVNRGDEMPFKEGFKASLLANNEGNQAQPLLLSSHGRIIWSEKPFAFEITKASVRITDAFGEIILDSSGNILRSAQLGAAAKYFPFHGFSPDGLLFSKPQYNTWIELTYNQNQQDILRYAKAVIDNGFPPGVLMIDDTWQTAYGNWEFNCRKFENPGAMVDSLHKMGFKVMLWIVPFVSMDLPAFRELRGKNAFLKSAASVTGVFTNGDVYPVDWWNGVSALLDFTNKDAVDWFQQQLDYLINTYHIDGFKFDAGDFNFYSKNTVFHQPILSNEQSELYAKFGLIYPLNEFRACWKMGGQPLAQRLRDKNHEWGDVQKLIPHMLAAGLMGYPFSCPDMIGGGDYMAFLDLKKFNQQLIVRSAQIHALMPMMQFSLAPWRVLDATHLNAVKEAVALRIKYTPEIMRLLEITKKTGEPIVRSISYNYPHKGYEEIKDQFMLGNKIMVAPVVQENAMTRKVILPPGKWIDDRGKMFKGPAVIDTDVPVDRLPVYTLQ